MSCPRLTTSSAMGSADSKSPFAMYRFASCDASLSSESLKGFTRSFRLRSSRHASTVVAGSSVTPTDPPDDVSPDIPSDAHLSTTDCSTVCFRGYWLARRNLANITGLSSKSRVATSAITNTWRAGRRIVSLESTKAGSSVRGLNRETHLVPVPVQPVQVGLLPREEAVLYVVSTHRA